MEEIKLRMYILISVTTITILGIVAILTKIFTWGKEFSQAQQENNDMKIVSDIQEKVLEVASKTKPLTFKEIVDEFNKNKM